MFVKVISTTLINVKQSNLGWDGPALRVEW